MAEPPKASDDGNIPQPFGLSDFMGGATVTPPPGSDLVLAVLEQEISSTISEMVAPRRRPDLTLVDKQANIAGQLVDYLEGRDSALTEEIVGLVEERRQVRAALGIYRGARGQFEAARKPQRKAKARRPNTQQAAAE